MAQRQIKCNYCDNGQDILYDPNASPKTTNLDGSYHKHVKYGGAGQQQQQQTQQQVKPITETVTVSETVSKPMVTKDEEYKIKQAVKEEAIAQAHKENMEEGQKLRASLGNLELKIDDVSNQIYNLNKTLEIFVSVLRSYVDSKQQAK